VIVLDDVFAELDGSRRERLADAVADYEQVLITAAVEGDVPSRLKAHTVRIAKGTIVDEAPVAGGPGDGAVVPEAGDDERPREADTEEAR